MLILAQLVNPNESVGAAAPIPCHKFDYRLVQPKRTSRAATPGTSKYCPTSQKLLCGIAKLNNQFSDRFNSCEDVLITGSSNVFATRLDYSIYSKLLLKASAFGIIEGCDMRGSDADDHALPLRR